MDKMTLEKLFSTLCERGWKPFGRFDKLMGYGQSDSRKVFQFGVLGEYEYYLRDMVSIESGLWQYVCENGLVRKDRFAWMISPDPLGEDQYHYTDYRYRLIESALCDEDRLEDFLLYNIKIDE